MKRLRRALTLALLTTGPFCWAQEIRVDWKNTYRLNAVLDGISTYQFRQHGAFELNPIAAPFVNRDRWVEAGALLLTEILVVDWLETKLKGKWKGLIYFLGSLAHGYCVWSNRSHGGTMIPIPLFRVRF